MGKLDRRAKLALDEAYRVFRVITKEEAPPDLFQLVRCLKTVGNALNGAIDGQLKLTVRLWRRIHLALFDKLFTSYPAHMVIYAADGSVVKPKKPIPEEGILEIHPEGLRREDDTFKMEIENLHPDTRQALNKIWTERGNSTRREDFANYDCGEYCAPKHFVIGDEVLTSESTKGKEQAYSQWWDLYWQAYCTSDQGAKRHILKQMESIEAVWGNLYY
jgi:hypothetical protein